MAQLTASTPATRSASGLGMTILGWVTLFSLVGTMYAALIWAPTDDFQGISQRIFYMHVPSSWLAYVAVGTLAISSIIYLFRNERVWDRIAVSAAEIGVAFTTLALVTGSLWGRQIWGAWWAWDARITSTLVLWLILVGYLMLRNALGEGPRTGRYAAALAIFGAIDIPIIHMSVTWWRTLHPMPIVVRPADGPQLPWQMGATLLIAVVTFTLFFIWLMITRYQLEKGREDVRTLRQVAEVD